MALGPVRVVVCLALALWTGAAAAATDEVERLPANGAEFAYVEAGRGEPVLLVHGGLQDHRLWGDLLPAFADRFRAVAYSRRNRFPLPLSEEGAPDGAADPHAEDLAAIVGALGLGRVHVVAHSSGATAALFFAAGHPELVRSLVLNEPPASGLLAGTPEGRAVLREQAARLAPAREAFQARDLERAVRLFTDGARGPGSFDRQPDADRRMAMDDALSHLADQVSTRPRAAFGRDAAKRVTAPTLLTGGERSPASFGRILDALERCLPRAERATMPGASHNAPKDNPSAFREAALAFLARQ